MNQILQKVLLGIGESVVGELPGGAIAVKAGEAIFAPGADKGDKVDAAINTVVATLNVLEQMEVVDFADEPIFQTGLQTMKAGATMMIGAVKAHKAAPKPVPTPAPAA